MKNEDALKILESQELTHQLLFRYEEAKKKIERQADQITRLERSRTSMRLHIKTLRNRYKFLSILLFQEDGYDSWVAQCLEHDIATQGKTKQDALDSLERTILGQIHLDTKNGIEPLSEIDPPPTLAV